MLKHISQNISHAISVAGLSKLHSNITLVLVGCMTKVASQKASKTRGPHCPDDYYCLKFMNYVTNDPPQHD